MELTNWGNYPRIQARFHSFSRSGQLAEILAEEAPLIARGLGRCYGDSSLGPSVVSTTNYKRMLNFDAAQGILTCEAGVSFEDILSVFVPRGWFPPVTPGTRYITVGGAVAADVHGKNHHIDGSFCRHVLRLQLMLADGTKVFCGPQERADLFELTRGGMGLTGIILQVAFRLKPIETRFIMQQTHRFPNLGAIMDAFEDSADTTYTVAWVDGLALGKSLGRSVLFRGEHALQDELPARFRNNPLACLQKSKLTVPFYAPAFTLNRYSIKAFNGAFYHKAPTRWKQAVIDYDGFFYPLDNILKWNRLYGRPGFTQYQFVLPLEQSRAGLIKILTRIGESGQGSFLGVLKLFGKQEGLLSFPREGYTLALDFPIKHDTFALLDELDRLVLDHGGRLYLAKDCRMNKQTFQKGYPRFETFMTGIRQWDPDTRLGSRQSQRTGVTP